MKPLQVGETVPAFSVSDDRGNTQKLSDYKGQKLISVQPLKDKLDTAAAYRYYDVVDSLYPITYSCESDYKIRLNNLKHCGKCFFCLERWYAFGRII